MTFIGKFYFFNLYMLFEDWCIASVNSPDLSSFFILVYEGKYRNTGNSKYDTKIERCP